jgi:hypothetical protein
MFSLAIIVSLIVLCSLLIGPIAYLSAVLKLPNIITYLLSIVCFIVGINFCFLVIPIWYLGLIPIFFGFISIKRTQKNKTQA